MDISVSDLKRRLDEADKSFFFLDVREPHEYEEFNLGAKLIPLGNLPTALEDLASHKNDEIIVHCRSGARSNQAKAFLMANGFTNVRNVEGGVLAWVENFGK